MGAGPNALAAHGWAAPDSKPRRRVRERARWIAVLAVLLLGGVLGTGCDWLQPGFDGGHSNFNPSEPALTASTVGSLTKQFSVPGAGLSNSPLVVDGLIAYTTANASGELTVRTLNADTGAPGWTTAVPGVSGYFSDLVSDGTTIYVADQDNQQFCGGDAHIVAMSAATGAIAWNVTLPTMAGNGCRPGRPTLTLGAGHLYLLRSLELSSTDGDWELTAIDTATGTALWHYDTEAGCSGVVPPEPTAATSDDSVAFAYCDTTVIFNPADGSVKWSSASLPAGEQAALYAARSGSFFGLYGSTICVGCTTQHLVAADANTGAIKWDTPEGGSYDNPEAITNDRLVVSSSNPAVPRGLELEALDVKSGLVDWVTDLPAGTFDANHVVVAGDLIYVATSDGTTATLRTYDLATGAPVSTTPLPASPTPTVLPTVIVAEGHVYLVGPNSIDAYAPAS